MLCRLSYWHQNKNTRCFGRIYVNFYKRTTLNIAKMLSPVCCLISSNLSCEFNIPWNCYWYKFESWDQENMWVFFMWKYSTQNHLYIFCWFVWILYNLLFFVILTAATNFYVVFFHELLMCWFLWLVINCCRGWSFMARSINSKQS